MSLHEALKLLKDDHLVWSEDFESVREPLAKLLTLIDQSPTHQFDDAVDEIVRNLSAPSKPDGFEGWFVDAQRQLGVYEKVASTSEQTRAALKKMFKAL